MGGGVGEGFIVYSVETALWGGRRSLRDNIYTYCILVKPCFPYTASSTPQVGLLVNFRKSHGKSRRRRARVMSGKILSLHHTSGTAKVEDQEGVVRTVKINEITAHKPVPEVRSSRQCRLHPRGENLTRYIGEAFLFEPHFRSARRTFSRYCWLCARA